MEGHTHLEPQSPSRECQRHKALSFPRHLRPTPARRLAPSFRALYLSAVASRDLRDQHRTAVPPRPFKLRHVPGFLTAYWSAVAPRATRSSRRARRRRKVAVFLHHPRPSPFSLSLQEAPRPSPERHRAPSLKVLDEGSRPSSERRCTPSLKVPDEAPVSHPDH
jgi:hypothetical protein